MKNNTPVKKDEEKDWREQLKALSWVNPVRILSYNEVVKFISRLLLRENRKSNELCAKKIVEMNDKITMLVADAFNRGYETALDERKGKV